MGRRAWQVAIGLASFVGAGLLASCGPAPVKAPPPAPDVDWPYYGADAGGQRFSPAAQITPANVTGLKVAWTYSTGDAALGGTQDFAFEDTPILAGGRLYVCALVQRGFGARSCHRPAGCGGSTRRSIAASTIRTATTAAASPTGAIRLRRAGAPCAARIFMNTNDRRLFALDAATGKLCPGFGAGGVVDAGAGRAAAPHRRDADHLAAGGGARRRGGRLLDRRQPAGQARSPARSGPTTPSPASRKLDLRSAGRGQPADRRRRGQRLGADVGRRGSAAWSSCPPPAPAPTSGAACAPATTATPTPWWR